VKKLYVLSALLVEEHQRHLKQQVQGLAGEVALLSEYNDEVNIGPVFI
jgi:hypothetical protein